MKGGERDREGKNGETERESGDLGAGWFTVRSAQLASTQEIQSDKLDSGLFVLAGGAYTVRNKMSGHNESCSNCVCGAQ